MNLKKPLIVIIFSLLLISLGTIGGIWAIGRLFTSPLPIQFWPLIMGGFLAKFLNAYLSIVAGIGIYKQRKWGWWLAGIITVRGLINSVLSLIQLFVMHINEHYLYKITTFNVCINLLLLYFIFNPFIREYLQVYDHNMKECVVKILFFGFLLFCITTAIVFMSAMLNMVINQ